MLGEGEVGGGEGHAYVDCFTEYRKHCCWMLKNLKVHLWSNPQPCVHRVTSLRYQDHFESCSRFTVHSTSTTSMDFFFDTCIISVYSDATDTKQTMNTE